MENCADERQKQIEGTGGTAEEDGIGAGAFEIGILFAVGGGGADSSGASEVERCGAPRCGDTGAAGAGSN